MTQRKVRQFLAQRRLKKLKLESKKKVDDHHHQALNRGLENKIISLTMNLNEKEKSVYEIQKAVEEEKRILYEKESRLVVESVKMTAKIKTVTINILFVFWTIKWEFFNAYKTTQYPHLFINYVDKYDSTSSIRPSHVV